MILKIGSRGQEVKDVQEFLKIGADGIFGKGTSTAVKNWQTKNNLPADGLVGPATWGAMGFSDTDLSNSSTSNKNSSSNYSKKTYQANGLDVVEYFMPKDEYKQGPIKPEWLFIHHTAGWHNPFNVITAWDNDSQGTIATEFVLGGPSVKGDNVEFDGTLVQAFPKGNYAWHLGKNGSQTMHKNSVGIEVCNFGYIKDGKTYAGTKVDSSQIVTLPKEFRGYKDWHRYSDKQLEILKQWILWMGERDGIDIRKGLPELVKDKGADAFEFNEDAFYGKVKGLWTHTNTRKDKFDMFPQPELLDMLMSL